MMDQRQILPLLSAAGAARQKAYAPYSRFRVGAALLAGERVIRGCNVENAAYGATLCAERGALAAAVAAGLREFSALAITSDSVMPVSPCGICRQALTEFCAESMPVVLGSADGNYVLVTLGELLPRAFDAHSFVDRPASLPPPGGSV